jgi:hypothetical protein
MKGFLCGAAAFLVLATAPGAQAGQERLAGNWHIKFFDQGDVLSIWLLKVDAKGNGTLEVAPDFPETKLKDFKVAGDRASVVLLFRGVALHLTFQLPKGEFKKLYGTLTFQGQVYPVQLVATALTSLKDQKGLEKIDYPKGEFKELRDLAAKEKDDLNVFETAEVLVAAADRENVNAADVKAALAPVLAAARQYGDAWSLEIVSLLSRKLAARQAYAALAEEMIQAELKTLGADGSAEKQMRLMNVLAGSLRKQGKKDEAAKVQARIDVLEVAGHEENEKAGLGFAPEKGPAAKGNRAVLVELFTGASCPPCVGADLAFEGLAKTYGRDVILLQYHLHIPRPDPLTGPDTIDRADYYDKQVEGTPTLLFNGKPGAPGGGGRGAARALYQEYRKVIDPLLNESTKATLTAAASRAGDKVSVQATVGGIDKPGDKLRLRFALVEPWVRYPGSNGLSYHFHVVRAMPGGAAGIAVTRAGQEEKLTVDLDALRQAASKHLDMFGDLEGQRPFSYRDLRLVVFLQDDATQEVLQAVEVPVK